MASDVIKNLNVKVFNLMSRTDETRHIFSTYFCLLQVLKPSIIKKGVTRIKFGTHAQITI